MFSWTSSDFWSDLYRFKILIGSFRNLNLVLFLLLLLIFIGIDAIVGQVGIGFLIKGEKVLKVNFLRQTSTTFEFSRQNDMQFLAKIDISACQIWLKRRFCTFEIVKIPSFWIWGTLKRAIFSYSGIVFLAEKFKCGQNHKREFYF